jgi:hypothetical protein
VSRQADEKRLSARQRNEGTAGKQNKPDKTEFRGFVNVRLNDQVKAGFGAWSKESDGLFFVEDFIREGYKLSITHEPDNDVFLVTAFCTAVESPNRGYIVSSRAGDVHKAIQRLGYYVLEVLPPEWSAYVASARDDNW